LGDVQHAGGAPDATALGDSCKVAQMSEFIQTMLYRMVRFFPTLVDGTYVMKITKPAGK
jgi:hypothetical protein